MFVVSLEHSHGSAPFANEKLELVDLTGNPTDLPWSILIFMQRKVSTSNSELQIYNVIGSHCLRAQVDADLTAAIDIVPTRLVHTRSGCVLGQTGISANLRIMALVLLSCYPLLHGIPPPTPSRAHRHYHR